MGLELKYNNGQTPLDEDEKEGLLIKTIGNRRELDEAEQLNIENAVEWTLRKKFKPNDILDEMFIRELHKRMYRDVWKWAGEFRNSNKNIGVDKYSVPVELRQLVDNGKFWLEEKVFNPDEIAVRFKHKLVSIHCFPNGNGRHSRLFADVMISHIFKQAVFRWSANNLIKEGEARQYYLDALKKADYGKYEQLILFARS